MEKRVKMKRLCKKWTEWAYWVPTWYKYWKYKQWLLKG